MPNPEIQPALSRVDIRKLRYKFRYGILPAGEIMASLTHLSEDKDTQEGLSQARDSLKNRGLLVLDAHLDTFDIIGTGVALCENVDLKVFVSPASAYNYYNPIFLGGFFSRLNALDGVEIYPVFRESDRKHPVSKRMNPHGMSDREKRKAVVNYIQRAKEVVNEPNQAVIVAAYNGVNMFKKKEIAPGVNRLLKRECVAICSFSIRESGTMKYRVFLSNGLLQFSKDASREDMRDAIVSSHEELIERASSI